MTVYTTTDGDVLDSICWRAYGRADMLEAVLGVNPGLAALGPVYSAGVSISLPPAPEPEPPAFTRMWS